jgi:hypothetical protein
MKMSATYQHLLMAVENYPFLSKGVSAVHRFLLNDVAEKDR